MDQWFPSIEILFVKHLGSKLNCQRGLQALMPGTGRMGRWANDLSTIRTPLSLLHPLFLLSRLPAPLWDDVCRINQS